MRLMSVGEREESCDHLHLSALCLSREWRAPNEHFLHVNTPYARTHTHTHHYVFYALLAETPGILLKYAAHIAYVALRALI